MQVRDKAGLKGTLIQISGRLAQVLWDGGFKTWIAVRHLVLDK